MEANTKVATVDPASAPIPVLEPVPIPYLNSIPDNSPIPYLPPIPDNCPTPAWAPYPPTSSFL